MIMPVTGLFVLTPFPGWFYKDQYLPFISLRIRPEADTDNFAACFYQDMTSQLQVTPFYLFDIQSYKEQKIERDAAEGITPYIRSARLIVVFFVFNVFIGLMGTFWFRTRHRRSEIALRMAMGSSRGRIRWQLLGEGLLLLALASIPALMICSNYGYGGCHFYGSHGCHLGEICHMCFYCLDIDGIDGDCRNLVSGFTGHEGAACRSIAR